MLPFGNRKMDKFEELPNAFYLNYGHLMKKMGQYDKAKSYYSNYKDIDESLAVHFMQSCDFAKAILFRRHQFRIESIQRIVQEHRFWS